MIFNLTESADDMNEVDTLFKKISLEPIPILKTTIRVGKNNKFGSRSLKVILPSNYDVQTVLKGRSKLEGTRVYIIPDLTPNKQEHEKTVRDQFKERVSQEEQNVIIKYIRGSPQIAKKLVINHSISPLYSIFYQNCQGLHTKLNIVRENSQAFSYD